jgi:bifunctional pyridoxal-dependent enzyme with beta-cystathionase and maltose regulon repressor activities
VKWPASHFRLERHHPVDHGARAFARITTPGDAFGSLGASHLRLSFATSRENLTRALAILRRYANEVQTE